MTMRAPRKPRKPDTPPVIAGDVEMHAPIEVFIGLTPANMIRFGLTVAETGAATISIDLSVSDACDIVALITESIELAQKIEESSSGILHTAGNA